MKCYRLDTVLKRLQMSIEIEQTVKIFITPEDSSARHITNVASKVTDAFIMWYLCSQVFGFANC